MFSLFYALNEILIVKQCNKIKTEMVIQLTKFIVFGFFNPVASMKTN